MHCYLVARCKTPGCKAKFHLAHVETLSDDPIVLDWPEKNFPVTIQCALCSRTHSYEAKEIQSESSREPRHDQPADWKPFLGPPGAPGTH
jgi:hypothetical protein